MYAQLPSQCTYSCFLGDSTQLGNRTANSVVKGAIAHRVFKGRFDCVVGCFRPFSTAFMLNTPHGSQTHGTWENQPSYALGLKTVWKEEPFSTSDMSNHTLCSYTHASWVIQPSYAIVLNTLWQREQLPVLLSEVALFVLLGVLGRFPHHSSHKQCGKRSHC